MKRKNLLIALLLSCLLSLSLANYALAQNQPEEEETLNFFKENFPPRYQRLLEMRQKHPLKFKEEMGKNAPRFRQLQRVRQNNPGEYQWQMGILRKELDCQRLKDDYRAAEPQRKPELKEQLRQQLNAIFDLKHEHQLQRVKDLEGRLRSLQAELDSRALNRQKIIEKRLEELLLENDNLNW